MYQKDTKRNNRRHFLLSGVALICQHCFFQNSSAQIVPQSSPPLGLDQNIKLQCGVNDVKDYFLDFSKIRKASGIVDFDKNISLELEILNKLFGVKPEFGFFDDDRNEPSAITVHDGDSKTYVLFGNNLLQHEIKRAPKTWESSVIGILAHEWAHAYQYRTYWREKKFIWETHADFLSGWYLGCKAASGVIGLEIKSFSEFLFLQGGKGGFYDENSHGKPIIRIKSMQAGYQHGLHAFRPGKRPNLYDAAEKGYKIALDLKGIK